MNRRIYDISVAVSPTLPIWPGDPGVELERVSDMDAGAHVNVSRLSLGVHTGTHLDAPVHFVPDGAAVETLDLNILVGPALVVHLPDAEAIDAPLLESLDLPPGTERVLFRTRNSDLWARGETAFHEDYVAVTAAGARWLVAHGVRLVGVDYLSVAPFSQTLEPHVVLLRAGVIPVEGLNLSGIEPGEYQLVCLPLKLAGSDGAPVRAILIAEE